MTFTPHAEYLDDIDILYITLSDAEIDPDRSGDIDLWRNVDRAADGSVVALEFVNASVGLNLRDVPHREIVERFAGDFGLPVLDAEPVEPPARRREPA